MKQLLILLPAFLLFMSCSKSGSTGYTTPPPPASGKRLIKFAYQGDVFGVPPIYEGLTDTPKHSFTGTGITESGFVKTKAGDTIGITIPLSSAGTKPVVTVTEDLPAGKIIEPVVTELPTPDATAKFRVIVR